jgi:transmembrane sensor
MAHDEGHRPAAPRGGSPVSVASGAGQDSLRIREQAEAWLARLRGGDPADQEAFETWFSADPAHADAYEELLDAWDRMGVLGKVDTAPTAATRPRWWSGRYAAVAMAVTILLAVASLAVLVGARSRIADHELVLASKVGEIRSIRLADGTGVILDSGTFVRFRPEAGSATLERGRARFVLTGAAPLTVAGDGLVTGHPGATFDLDRSAGTMTATLIEGDLVARHDPRDEQGFALAPGQVVTIGTAPRSFAPHLASRGATRWTTGMLSFDHATLADVVAAANRYSAVKIALDPRVAALRFTGTIHPARTDALARLLAETFALALGHTANGAYLMSPSPGAKSPK